MPNDKNIIKLQNAGNVPSVNEYGLTEEEMASVRDNMRRYKISEEDAVSAKIKAKELGNVFRDNVMGNLDGPIGEAYQSRKELNAMKSRWNFDKLEIPKITASKSFTLPTIQENIKTNFRNSISTDPYWRIKASLQLNQNNLDFNHKVQAQNAYTDWLVKHPLGQPPSGNALAAEGYGDYINWLTDSTNKFNQYEKEYLEQHPLKEFVRNSDYLENPHHKGGGWDDPQTRREQAAYDYAQSKTNGFRPSNRIITPIHNYDQIGQSAGQAGLIGGAIGITLPLMAEEAATYGLAGFIPRFVGGMAGSYLGEKGGEWVGDKLDSRFKTKWIKPTLRTVGGFWGWGKGSNLAYKGGLRAILPEVRRAAALNINFANRPTWSKALVGDQMVFDAGLLKGGVDPTKNIIKWNDFKYNLMDRFGKRNWAQLSPAYKQGGLLKFQEGGLVYKPFIAEKERIIREAQPAVFDEEESYSYTPEENDNFDLEVEPVLVYRALTDKRERVTPPTDYIEYTPVQVDNTRVTTSKKGKVYASSEKETFKLDLYNAYDNALKRLGLNEEKASAFAKRFTAQDVLESNWGQSSLSKYFNFGGIKDFSGKGVQKDTTEYINGNKTTMKQGFRQFSSIDDYVNYKIDLVQRKWNVLNSDPKDYFSLIVSGKQKYATDPNYTSKLESLYKQIWKE